MASQIARSLEQHWPSCSHVPKRPTHVALHWPASQVASVTQHWPEQHIRSSPQVWPSLPGIGTHWQVASSSWQGPQPGIGQQIGLPVDRW